MHIVSYRQNGGTWRAGVERDKLVFDIGLSPDSSVKALLARGPSTLIEACKRAETTSALRDVEIGPPVPDPEKIICIGLNYRTHVTEVGVDMPKAPTFFAKFRNALIGPGAAVRMPRTSSQIDYEVELAAIIGTRCKDVDEGRALDYVGGYSILNDVSARDLQLQTSQWGAGKAIDTFAPFGPWLIPASEIPDPQTLSIKTRVNGTTLQDSNTSDMVFTVAQLIAFLSGLMTLEPGDVIATGTPSGVGHFRKPPIWLKDGDVVEQEIERIGILRNPIAAAVSAAV